MNTRILFRNKWLKKITTGFSFFLITLFAYAGNNPEYVTLQNGAQFQTAKGLLRVEFVSSEIVRVQYTQEIDFLGNGTIVCVDRSVEKVPFQTKKMDNSLVLLSESLIVQVDLKDYSIIYKDAKTNQILLSEKNDNPREGEPVYTEKVTYDEQSKRIVKTADGEKEVMDVIRRDTIGYSWKFRNHFQWADNEAIYGLGSHMEDYLNLRGKELYLCQHNLKAMVPVLNSTAGYGLLFDAGCGMIYTDKDDDSFIELEAAKQIDYYFMKGATMDEVIKQYRILTGSSPMMPRYMFGYIQSKERYKSSKEVTDVVAEYRKRQVPLDVIVQDWNYWPQGWGYLKMDPKYYPNPANLADSVHQMDAKLMISIWPNPTSCPQTDDFKGKGFMLERSVYDAYNPLARKYYWKYADNEFFNNGFDAWWCDCTEPLDADWQMMKEGYGWDNHRERWENNLALLSDVLGAERSSTFSLYHSKGLYENQRVTSDKKRVVNLTRSSYAGQQRYATISWNGDTHASWSSFAQQIPSGLNFMATGCPYWTVDIGAFFTKKTRQWFWCGDFNQGVNDLGYREFYTRMFQYATFLPIFRSHGTDTPREIWNFGKPGEPFYDSILKMIHLRYQLIPYIYSLAGKVSHDHYTMSRLLAFDFPNDPNVFDIKNQFMFGPSFLVCPVTTPMYYEKESVALHGVEKKRNVYLPKGANWIDFWTGERYEGGQYVDADASIDKIPLFVRQGSIIPMGSVVQHTGELRGKDITISVYPGQDASFTFYEDEGDNYNYEQGYYSTIELKWNDKKRTFTLAKRNGEYDNMEKVRTIHIELHDKKKTVTKTVRYSGDEVSCRY
ncbi:glycoside hydrolase family 31 protein [Parabacteroides sp. OttesenSCG-928-J18]|nr:glycoside hydrolase family 31 protein [Parabacteroides sp. OttesenSCG-928-J18]